MSTHTIVSIIALLAYTALMLYVGIGKAYDKDVVSTSRGFFIGGGTGYFVLFFTTAATWFSTWIYMGAPAPAIKTASAGSPAPPGSCSSCSSWASSAPACGGWPRAMST